MCQVRLLGRNVAQCRKQTHSDSDIFLFQLLDEGSLSLSLLVHVIVHLVGHQYIVKCPPGGLFKDNPPHTLLNIYTLHTVYTAKKYYTEICPAKTK